MDHRRVSIRNRGDGHTSGPGRYTLSYYIKCRKVYKSNNKRKLLAQRYTIHWLPNNQVGPKALLPSSKARIPTSLKNCQSWHLYNVQFVCYLILSQFVRLYRFFGRPGRRLGSSLATGTYAPSIICPMVGPFTGRWRPPTFLQPTLWRTAYRGLTL